MYNEIGTLTRDLHDALDEMGHLAAVQRTAEQIPGARVRLKHIAELTGGAAERALNAVDAARAEQERQMQLLDGLLADLQGRAPRVLATDSALQAFSALREGCERTNALLTEIMLAQDFHDLTTQIVQRVLGVATGLEDRLLKLLVALAPQARGAGGGTTAAAVAPAATADERAAGAPHGLMGPMKGGSHPDVLADQTQVDDLLASLGF